MRYLGKAVKVYKSFLKKTTCTLKIKISIEKFTENCIQKIKVIKKDSKSVLPRIMNTR